MFEIERTILYGIRTGNSKSRSVTDMPGFGQRGVLNDADIRNVVQYVLKVSGRRYQVEAANEGRRIYTGNANCGDCHAADGRGDTYYGAPKLTANVWNSGGEPDDLYRAIYFGQHRTMQAWFPTLSLFEIRALAVYLYAVSREPAAARAPRCCEVRAVSVAPADGAGSDAAIVAEARALERALARPGP